MRSDFWSLPYAARRAIQRGSSAQHEAERLQARVHRLEAENAQLRAEVERLRREGL